MNFKAALGLGFSLAIVTAWAADESKPAKTADPAPATDRVHFPEGYATKFKILRTVERKEKAQVVTVYGNEPAASVTSTNKLPYPYGSVIVMETSDAEKGADGKPILDASGRLQRKTPVGLHVMRREKDFGAAYGPNRSGEWEFVEYKPDGSYITPAPNSATCAACHIKAGAAWDYVYEARLGAQRPK